MVKTVTSDYGIKVVVSKWQTQCVTLFPEKINQAKFALAVFRNINHEGVLNFV